MKFNLTAALFLTIGFTANTMATNTIRFVGEVTDQTCTVKVNGVDASPVLLLPTANTASLATAGSTAGDLPFIISLSGCSATATQTKAQVRFISNDIDGTGLRNIAAVGPATNVALQILDGVTPLNFTGGDVRTTTVKTVGGAGSSPTADFALTARYVSAAGGARPGAVEARTQFAITYQ